jgi:hypothetical protein
MFMQIYNTFKQNVLSILDLDPISVIILNKKWDRISVKCGTGAAILN